MVIDQFCSSYKHRLMLSRHRSDVLPTLPEYDEVKVGISSMPGYRILAARKGKSRQGRSNTVYNLVEDGKERMSIDSGTEGGGSILRKISRRTPNLRSKGKGATPVPKIDITSEPSKELTKAQTDGSIDIPSKGDTSRSVAAGPDLTSVKEEERVEEGTVTPKQTTYPTEEIKPPKRMSRNELRPLVMIQSPSENGVQMQPTEEKPLRLQPTPLSNFNASFISSSASDTEENDEDQAQTAAAENAQRNLLQSSSLYTGGGGEDLHLSPSSSSSSESQGDGSTSDSEASSIAPTQQEEYFLALEHGNELNVKQKKRLLKRMRKSKMVTPEREAAARHAKDMRQGHARKGSLSSKVQVGLHYASSQSRNRRAMEKYSPHPSRPSSTAPFSTSHAKNDSTGNLADILASARKLSMTTNGASAMQSTGNLGDISRSSTPNFLLNGREAAIDGSRRSSMSDSQRVLGSAAEIDEADFCMSPIAADGIIDRDEQWADLSKSVSRRKPTANSITSSMTGQGSFKKRYFSLRRRKQDTSDVVEESGSEDEAIAREEGEKELENVLRKLVVEQAPDQVQEQYEYDVLYENQRGIMFFGIPKFSARTLFQWDPSPWTNAFNGSSAYNIVNAQLPNPFWEWVQPEWLIDMSGDVDESGWQYSHNFGRFSLNIFTRPTQAVPRANAHGNVIMNDRVAQRLEKRKEKEETREDHGFEALKRTARTRNAKWTGIPDQNKYVRKRRWIRLRRRREMTLPIRSTPHQTPGRTTPTGIGNASTDWTHLVKSEEQRAKSHIEEEQMEELRTTNDDTLTSSSSSSSGDDLLSSLESDEAGEYASEGGDSSSFLPRRTPGQLDSNPSLVGRRADRERERQKRHAKEFSGSLKELKTLLPAILDPRSHHRPLDRQRVEHETWMSEIDARNPFLSWNLVKKRLEDDDLAFATTSLRARERRYAQRIYERRERQESRRGTIDGHQSTEPFNHRDPPFALTKDAVVEINYRRVMRVMKACRVDRQKILLWKVWLGVEPISALNELAKEEDLASSGLVISLASSTTTPQTRDKKQNRIKGRKAVSHADSMDVWDLLERRLDRLLLTFEYQGSRSTLLILLLSLHASSHANHRFRPSQWGMDIDGERVEPNAPSTLSPYLGSRDTYKEDGLPDRARSTTPSTPAGEEWKAVKLPRLEFWSDLEKCAKALQLDGFNSSSSRLGTPILKAIAGDASPSQLLGPTFATTAPYSSSPTMSSLTNGVFNSSSPVPSIRRSNTPGTTMGSLSNGPSARRLSHHTNTVVGFPPSFLNTSTSAINGRHAS